MQRLLVIAMLVLACDQKEEQAADAAPALSAIVAPLPPPSQSQSPPLPASAASSRTPPPPADAGTACGTKPLPDCPLQAWMKQNMSPPMKSHDWQGMADSLERAATFAPAGYTNWVSIAKDGANAARAADLEAVKAACRGCHEQYKNKYRAEMRTRPVP